MKAAKYSVQGTVFLPLLGHVEWSEKLEAAETAATCFVLEVSTVVKSPLCRVARGCDLNTLSSN